MRLKLRGSRSSGQFTTTIRFAQGWQGPYCAVHGPRAASSLLRVDEPAGLAPAGLRPELVPSVEVVKVLPTVNNPAVLEFKDDAVANIQVLAIPVRDAALDPDNAALVIWKRAQQLGPAGAARLLRQLAEVGQGSVAALVIVGHRAPTRQVPHDSLVEDVDERVPRTRD